MSDNDNLFFRNGVWYDKTTSNRVFVKRRIMNDCTSNDTNTHSIVENSTESLIDPLQATIKRRGRPPMKKK